MGHRSTEAGEPQFEKRQKNGNGRGFDHRLTSAAALVAGTPVLGAPRRSGDCECAPRPAAPPSLVARLGDPRASAAPADAKVRGFDLRAAIPAAFAQFARSLPKT
jgi:hypothetical protein